MKEWIHRLVAAGCAAALMLLAGCGAPVPEPVTPEEYGTGPSEATQSESPAPESEAGEEHPVTEPPPDRVVPAIGGEGHLCGLPPVDTLGAAYRTGYETFTVRMLQELYGKPEAINGVFFSPASLYMALGMAAEGMRGSTLEQTLSLLAAEDRPALRQGNRELQSLMSGNTKGYFHLANAVWLRESFASCVKPGFLDLNREYYGAKVALHPFDTSLVPDVNRWVSDNTDGLIPRLLDEVPDGTLALLMNTVLFDGKWLVPFGFTRDGVFHGADGDVDIPMMTQKADRPWIEDSLAQVTLLDYLDERTAMLVAVPKGTLDDLVRDLRPGTLSGWLSGMKEETTSVTMPRFSLEYGGSLKKTLQAMGMTDAFDERKADLSDMADGLFLGDVIHKTALQVGEAGTKAAAATAVAVCGTAAVIEEPKILVADRPFLCMILDKPTGAVLFAGTVENPQILGAD